MKLELTIAYPKNHDDAAFDAVTFEEAMTDEHVVISKKLLGPLLTAMYKLEENGSEAYGNVSFGSSGDPEAPEI